MPPFIWCHVGFRSFRIDEQRVDWHRFVQIVVDHPRPPRAGPVLKLRSAASGRRPCRNFVTRQRIFREEGDQFTLFILTEQLVSLTRECRGLGYCLHLIVLYPNGVVPESPDMERYCHRLGLSILSGTASGEVLNSTFSLAADPPLGRSQSILQLS